jgi:hypothetical protein
MAWYNRLFKFMKQDDAGPVGLPASRLLGVNTVRPWPQEGSPQEEIRPQKERRRRTMKDVSAVLYEKENALRRVQREVDCLRVVAALLHDEQDDGAPEWMASPPMLEQKAANE